MRVLVDTSVWSLALARRAPRASVHVDRLARAIRDGEVVMIGVVLQETLQAFRSERDHDRAKRALAAFPLLRLSRADYEAAAELHRACAAEGLDATAIDCPTAIDCQIAAAALNNKCKLLTADADFRRIAAIRDLDLL